MAPSTPFVDRETGSINVARVIVEAIPLAKLVGLVAVVASIPFSLVFLVGGRSLIGSLFAILGQFVLAVGTGVVLIYVIARAIRIADE